jgi:hypothetical protein
MLTLFAADVGTAAVAHDIFGRPKQIGNRIADRLDRHRFDALPQIVKHILGLVRSPTRSEETEQAAALVQYHALEPVYVRLWVHHANWAINVHRLGRSTGYRRQGGVRR